MGSLPQLMVSILPFVGVSMLQINQPDLVLVKCMLSQIWEIKKKSYDSRFSIVNINVLACYEIQNIRDTPQLFPVNSL